MAFDDQIGQRLDHPEHVPAAYQHLIDDDRQRVARILSIPVEGLILDVGCSDGAITKRIADAWPVHAIGIDLQLPSWSPGSSYDGRLEFQRVDIRMATPTPSADYDAIYCCEMLEHLPAAQGELVVRRLTGLLKPGGTLIVTVPNRQPADHYEVGCRARWAWPDHRQGFTLETLQGLLTGYLWVRWLPIYNGETPQESIWLMAVATK